MGKAAGDYNNEESPVKQNTQSKRGEALYRLKRMTTPDLVRYYAQVGYLLRKGEVFMVDQDVVPPAEVGKEMQFTAPPYPITVLEFHPNPHDVYFFMLDATDATAAEEEKAVCPDKLMVFVLSLHFPGSELLPDNKPPAFGVVDYAFAITNEGGFACLNPPFYVENKTTSAELVQKSFASISNTGSSVMRTLEALSQFEYDTVPAPKRLNKKRAEKGKPPFYEYHTLTLRPRKPEPGPDLGGTHASPRRHKRRGHYRHLASGAVVWVRNCVVGSGSEGVVEKDYQITA